MSVIVTLPLIHAFPAACHLDRPFAHPFPLSTSIHQQRWVGEDRATSGATEKPGASQAGDTGCLRCCEIGSPPVYSHW